MRLISLLCILLSLAFATTAQDIKYETSDAIDISKNGYDKLLQMRNGNTLLFHFEYRKGIVVKVFDASHKEIASQKHLCKIIDINTLDHAELAGLYDINGEAVLFITQAVDNRHTIVRLRIDATTARLISEDKVVQSESFQKKIVAGIRKDKNSDNYFIVTEKTNSGFVEKKINITKYNSNHQTIKEIPVNIDQKGYDDANMESIDIDDNGGIMLTITLEKIIQYTHSYNYNMVLCYLPPGGDSVLYKQVQMPAISSSWSYSTWQTENPFANSLNLLLSVNVRGLVQNGTLNEYITYRDQLLMVMNEDMSAVKFMNLKNAKIREQIFAQLDTNQEFSGDVINMYTNQFGLSTVLYRGTVQARQNLGRVNTGDIKRAVAVTQYNDLGEEIYGGLFPVSRIRTYHDYHAVLDNTTDDGLCGMAGIKTKSNYYVMYNDVNKDYGMKLSELKDSIYNCEFTNARFYKLDRKKQATQTYLFGQPAEDEYRHISASSGNFDDKTNTYAVLYLHKKGKEYSSQIAWCHFE
jgi:hypothetical protein